MSLEEKVGQLFMLGFPQKSFTPELEQLIQQYKPGAFLLFKRNIASLEQIKELNKSLSRASYRYTRLPPLIAIDQEGGSVSRLPIFPAPPNALAIGQTKSPLLAEGLGLETGKFLRMVGFNMNLAPVLDIANPDQNSFIGVRSFGADPALVAQLGTAYAKGLLQAHVIPTAKHFPGTGNLTGDPHLHVLKNVSPLHEMKHRDLKPFEEYSKLGDKTAIMLSHLIYPALDPSNEPASFSKKISTDILRNHFKYKGLVVTDDLQMQGAKQLLRPEVAALKALQSGADIIMLTWSVDDQRKAFHHVVKAAQSGAFLKQDIESKVRRILTAKAYVNSFTQQELIQGFTSQENLTSPQYAQFVDKLFDTILSSELSVTPKARSHRAPSSIQRLCVIAPHSSFIDSFKSQRPQEVQSKLINDKISGSAMSRWISNSACSLVVAAVTGKKTAALLKSLTKNDKRKILAVNLGAPSLIGEDKGYLKVVKLYFNHTDSGKKIAQYLDQILRDLNFQIASN